MELAPGIHRIGSRKGGHVRAYLVEHGRRDLILIDTLDYPDAREVLAEIRRLGRSGSDLSQIVLTHGHRAHLRGLATLKRWSGAPVFSHPLEADVIAGERKPQAVTIVPRAPGETYWWQAGLALGFGRHDPCPVDEPLDEGCELGPLQVLHTPGHSPGHLSFYWPERRALISGDILATWPRVEAGWPAFTLNAKDHRISLRRLAALEAHVVGVGHGDPILSAGEQVHILAEAY